MYFTSLFRCFCAFFLLVFSFSSNAYTPQTGDMIFHQSQSSQSAAIQLITQSQYSHMGMIMMRENKPYVFEAVSTIRYTPLDKWIARGKNSHVVIKRVNTPLTDAQKQKLHKLAASYLGTSYDTHFEWSDNRMYCSELAWKMYDKALNMQIGQLQKIKDFNLSHPIIQKKLTEYYSKKTIPQNEIVISPVSMFNSSKLITVFEQ